MSQQQYRQSVPIPYGIAHPVTHLGCLQIDADGRIVCIDLSDGVERARSESPLNPLLIEEGFLVAWSPVPAVNNRLELQRLAYGANQLQPTWRCEVALPDWVYVGAGPSPVFSIHARPADALLHLFWKASQPPSRGAFQSRKVNEASRQTRAGEVVIQIDDGELVSAQELPWDEPNPEMTQRAYQLPRVAYKRATAIDSSLWTVGSLDLLLIHSDTEQGDNLFLKQWDHESGQPVAEFRLGSNADVTPLISLNGAQVFVPRLDELDVFSAVSGTLLATIPDEQDLADLAVVGELGLYRIDVQRVVPEEGRIYIDHGLRVRNTATRALLWERTLYHESIEPPMHFQRS